MFTNNGDQNESNFTETEGRIAEHSQAIGGNGVRLEEKTNSKVEDMNRNLEEDYGLIITDDRDYEC